MSNGVSEFGKELGLVHEVIVAGRDLGAERPFYVALANSSDLFREVVELVNRALEHREEDRPKFDVRVDYSKTREQMIKGITFCTMSGSRQDGHEYKFSMIDQCNREVHVTVEAFRFFLNEPVVDIIAQLDALGYRPANFEEQIAVVAQHPEKVKELMECNDREYLIALGSVDKKAGISPHIDHFGGFSIGGTHIRGSLNSRYWVLAVKKS